MVTSTTGVIPEVGAVLYTVGHSAALLKHHAPQLLW